MTKSSKHNMLMLRRKLTPFIYLVLSIATPGIGYGKPAELNSWAQSRTHPALLCQTPESKSKIKRTRAHYSTRTDERGEYHILGLPAGQYVLSVEQAGFQTLKQSGHCFASWGPRCR